MSLWLDESPPEPRPALDHDASADVVVIGAGVAGVATAYWLARARPRPPAPEERTAIYEDDGELHPVRYVRGLAGAAEAAGATFHERTCVTAIDAGAVRTGRARVSAGAVVVCVNAYASHLLPLRIRPVRGQMLATAPLERRVFARPAYAHRGYRYWRQREDG